MKKAFKEKIPGGRARGMKPEDFDPVQLADGVKVEREHTDDDDLATEIAMDHLREDPDYYKKLRTIDPHEEKEAAMKSDVIMFKGAMYKLAEDPKVEEAKNDVGKVAARIRGAIGLIHEEKWSDAGKLLEELLKDLEEAKDDVVEEAKK